METLTLNGKEYVKASRAAKDLGYASDYVGQLCRSGSVDAHLVGRTWYVNPETLGAHRLEKKRNSRIKAREYARKSIEASRTLSVRDTAKSYKNIAIRYQPDTDAVIPEVKKVHIVTEKYVEHQPIEEETGTPYEVLNKDKKIIMSGSIPVYDAEEETQLTDTVTLSPKIVKTAKKEPMSDGRGVSKMHIAPQVSDEEVTTVQIAPVVPTFEEKLAKADVHTDTIVPSTTGIDTQTSSEPTLEPQGRHSVHTVSLVILWLGVMLSVAGLFFEKQVVYSGGDVTDRFKPTTEIIQDFILTYKDISSLRY